MAKQYGKELIQRQGNKSVGGSMLLATILLLLTTTVATAAIIPADNNGDCSTVICSERLHCPADSIALKPAFYFQSVDELNYADSYDAFIANNNSNHTATEAATTAKPTTTFITTTNAAESAPQREKRAALPLFEHSRDDNDNVFQQQQLLQRCCGTAKQHELECQCAPCATLPKCASDEVAVMTHKGRGTPGDCCARYVCQPEQQCGDNTGAGVGANTEFWRDRCTKCNCLGRIPLCHNVCPQNDEDNEYAMLHGRHCFSEQLEEFMENGKEWLEDNDCTECSCNNGERQCTTNVCRKPRCKQPIKIEGKCCPVCPETELEDEEQTESELEEITTWKYIEASNENATTPVIYTTDATMQVDEKVKHNIGSSTGATMKPTNAISSTALPTSTESSDASDASDIYHAQNTTTESTISVVDADNSSELGGNINGSSISSSISSSIDRSNLVLTGNTESTTNHATETTPDGDASTLSTTIDANNFTTNNSSNNNMSSTTTAYNESSEIQTTKSPTTQTNDQTTASTTRADDDSSAISEQFSTATTTITETTKDNTTVFGNTGNNNSNTTSSDTEANSTTTTMMQQQHYSNSETTVTETSTTAPTTIAIATSSPQSTVVTESPAARNYLYTFSTGAPSTVDSSVSVSSSAAFSTHTASSIATSTEYSMATNIVSTSTPFILPESQPTVLQQTVAQQRMPVVIIGGAVVALVLIISVIGFCYMRTHKASSALKKTKTSEAAKLYYSEHNAEANNPNFSEPNSEATKLFHNVPSSQSTSLCHTPTTSCSSMA